MKIYKELVQGTDEWIQIRLGKLSASKAQAIAANGKGLETLCFEKIAEILTKKQISTYKNEAMENGNETEEEARTVYSLSTGNEVNQVGFIEMDEMVGCSPDGLVRSDGLVEIKCPTPKVFAQYLYSKKIDSKYFAQMQMQMLVANRKWCDYVVFNPDFPTPIIIKKVERDEKFIEKLRIGLEAGKNKIKQIMEEINVK